MTNRDPKKDAVCAELLKYLYETATRKMPDCQDIDTLVQEAMFAYLVKLERGEEVSHPKAFLSRVLTNKYNDMLRVKYRNNVVSYESSDWHSDMVADKEEPCNEEYIAVRRELARLMKIYREVAVRYYVHGESVDEISLKMGIARGTVLSRLATARSQIKEGMEDMEKYSQYSYAPKSVSLSIWGTDGFAGEPFSLVRTPVEDNVLVLAYENPVSVRGLADTMGIPCAYLEPVIDTLIKGELMGKTSGGLVYTRCFVQNYEDSFGDIPAQEAVAEEYAEAVWAVAWKHLQPLTQREEFVSMTEKQRATMVLFMMMQSLSSCVRKARPCDEEEIKHLPERPNGGKWFATATVREYGEDKTNKYDRSGPVCLNYRVGDGGKNLCQLFDCQSLFGDAHWAYPRMKYKVNLQSIMRFYASFLPCDVKTDNAALYELIPEFEKLCILRRDESGNVLLDIPALSYEEVEVWNPVSVAMEKELEELISGSLTKLYRAGKRRVPKYVDNAPHYRYAGNLNAYVMAQLVAIVEKGLMPYSVEIGKTPLIYLAYKKREET